MCVISTLDPLTLKNSKASGKSIVSDDFPGLSIKCLMSNLLSGDSARTSKLGSHPNIKIILVGFSISSFPSSHSSESLYYLIPLVSPPWFWLESWLFNFSAVSSRPLSTWRQQSSTPTIYVLSMNLRARNFDSSGNGFLRFCNCSEGKIIWVV